MKRTTMSNRIFSFAINTIAVLCVLSCFSCNDDKDNEASQGITLTEDGKKYAVVQTAGKYTPDNAPDYDYHAYFKESKHHENPFGSYVLMLNWGENDIPAVGTRVSATDCDITFVDDGYNSMFTETISGYIECTGIERSANNTVITLTFDNVSMESYGVKYELDGPVSFVYNGEGN